MKRFRVGDLAITINTRLPEINDGHLVRIVEVCGPVPKFGLSFAYAIERVDGKLLFTREMRMERCVLASHHQLRPLREPPETVGTRTKETIEA